MMTTSARLLQLLTLLQTRPFWPGSVLAERLEVSTRTVRNDIDRLRDLGYPIDSTPGVAGGYRLVAGASMPPLLLDDEEVVAIAIGLAGAASAGSVAGMAEASLRALAKMHQVLPSHLRHRIATMESTMVAIPSAEPVVAADELLTIAAACRDALRLRFDYRTHSGSQQRRVVEPYRLALRAGRWYLLGFDLERDDWRTFRVDRMEPRLPAGPRFTPRELPPEGPGEFIDRGVASAPWQFRARVVISAPADIVSARLPAAAGVVTALDEFSCLLETGSDDPAALLRHLSMLDLDFSVTETPELAAEARRLAERLFRASGSPALGEPPLPARGR